MRVFCFVLLSMFAVPLHAATWECKSPIEEIPWSKVKLVAVTGNAGDATIRYSGETYPADYVRKGSTHFWRVDDTASGGFEAVLSIRDTGSGLMQRKQVMSGVLMHARIEFVCRIATAEEA